MCSKVIVECIICFDELEESSSSSSSQLALTHEASPNTKKLKRAYTENFCQFDNFDSQNLRSSSGTNIIT